MKRSSYFPEGPGGWIGSQIYQKLMEQAFGPYGTALLLGTVYFFSLLFIFTKDIGIEVEKSIWHLRTHTQFTYYFGIHNGVCSILHNVPVVVIRIYLQQLPAATLTGTPQEHLDYLKTG